jgi:hypothetical protein
MASVVIFALLLFSKYLLTILSWIANILLKFPAKFSCLTLQCAKGVNALSAKTVGVISRLLIVGKAISARRHSLKKAATIFGT